MISLSNDHNIEKIAKKAGLLKLQTDREYRIYGLAEDYKDLGLIDFPKRDKVLYPIACNVNALFYHNNIKLSWQDVKEGDKISIGLRRDLREHVELAASILQTIIFALEERMTIDSKMSKTAIPGIPKFAVKDNKKIEKSAEKKSSS